MSPAEGGSGWRPHRLDHAEDGKAARLQQGWVQIDVDSPDLSGSHRRSRDVGDLFDLVGRSC